MILSVMKLNFVILISILLDLDLANADNCEYKTPDGILDLRVFGNPDRPKYTDIPDASPTKALRYSFNGCFSYSAKDTCRNAAACMTDVTTQTSTTIARQAGRTFTYNSGLSQLVYTDGGQITFRVFLICGTEETIKAGQTDEKTYYLSLNSPCACAGKCTYKPSSGLGGGSIFVLVLICIVAAYLLFGVVILRFFKQQRGLDMIPHRSFWTQTTSDSVAGVRFVIGKVTGRSNAYEKV